MCWVLFNLITLPSSQILLMANNLYTELLKCYQLCKNCIFQQRILCLLIQGLNQSPNKLRQAGIIFMSSSREYQKKIIKLKNKSDKILSLVLVKFQRFRQFRNFGLCRKMHNRDLNHQQAYINQEKLEYSLQQLHNIMESNISENQIFLTTIVQENPIPYYFQESIHNDISYLKKGDSELYIQQFLSIDSKTEMTQQKNQNSKNQSDNHETQLFEIKSQVQENNESKNHISQIKKKNQQTKKSDHSTYNPSTFHNFQKHLTISLRLLIQIQPIRSDKESIVLAKKFWKIFKESPITAKKMLHYILGERNQHSIDDKLIQKFGFKQLYQDHSESLINEAKCFLRSQSLRQLQEANLQKYTANRRIKNQRKFIMYIQEFMNELEEGFLKKRVKKQKILKDDY